MTRWLCLFLPASCTCENADDWDRTLSVSIVDLNPRDFASGELEVFDDDGDLRFACSARFEGTDAIPIVCDQDVLGTSFYEPTREWLTSFRLGRRFRGGTLALRLLDGDGTALESWQRPLVPFWDGALGAEQTCGDLRGNVVVDTTGRPRGLP